MEFGVGFLGYNTWMKILAIETSCDDTAAAVLENNMVLSNVISSQIDLHSQWGGVVPDIAKRAHQERIMPVIAEALRKGLNLKSKGKKIEEIIGEGMKNIDVIAVTLGPGLAIALSVGVNKSKELAIKYKKKLVAVNHIEGHLLSNWVKNSKEKPFRKIEFPALTLTASGGHTKIILMQDIGKYEVVGETLDDAAGEALDKASKLLGLGYPGGPVIERLAKAGDVNFMELPRPMEHAKNLDYSFSGLKTSFYYRIKDWPKSEVNKNLENLAASFQNAVFESLLIKFRKAVEIYRPKTLLASGGVMANLELRKRLRKLAKDNKLKIFMPFRKDLNTDNAMMIGVAGYYKALRGEFVKNIEELDRDPRAMI
ncbi:MAG: putative tRNA threonylcarbamoyladenosine biosynthesis protein Gcp [Candidatus Shapirobacteria bacterium GW2011_GWE1_38_92]|uniref:tRNA N6-adenosine threonylcarbamoyltransferase n=3 Tax=Candidatus Shapironibacteriota TaxID=1752721 RepID=A0A0G0M7H1_9BACT|nr:MAG: putative tRNA threonylcarbamoyladenosine biosynthesis protein Gcp [Candidatus Shapirobacteria bacterium GW2011_GWE2_38_30]KKQ91646.1 MAG: putative tRNA threonylcarbamoyladenosine biosynthesis protein Gcp [Candidatus Shapirobacteria bacterium GW2011_GWE1_38_92]